MINKNELGTIDISNKAIEDMALIAIKGIKGVVINKKEASTIDCDYKNDELKLVISIKMKKDIDVVKTSNKLQTKVHEVILEMTGIDCKSIDVKITGFVA